MYGATPGGGNQTGCGDLGCGIIYGLSPDGQGNWTETILYNFCQNFNGISCLDGAYPNGLTIDTVGNLYGTTFSGGTGQGFGFGTGIAFELSPPKMQGGTWTETVLHNFCSDVQNDSCLDGWVGVVSPMVIGPDGNLYGNGRARRGCPREDAKGLRGRLNCRAQARMWTWSQLVNFCSARVWRRVPRRLRAKWRCFRQSRQSLRNYGIQRERELSCGGNIVRVAAVGNRVELQVTLQYSPLISGPLGQRDLYHSTLREIYNPTLSAIYSRGFQAGSNRGEKSLSISLIRMTVSSR